jgi:hypothetical protein
MQFSTLILLVIIAGISNAHRASSLLSYIPKNYHSYLNEHVKSDLGKLNFKNVAIPTSFIQFQNTVDKTSSHAKILAEKYGRLVGQKLAQFYNELVSNLSPSSKKMFADVSGNN